ncbi:eukaryotic translation initiation factor 3G family protein [Salix suchowensis]|nr:eukaryotic translation initiation factor 3G family protein [Salix suchowensis]
MYVVDESAKPTKMRWGELDEEDGENGIKKETGYKFNDDGNKVKITTTTRVRKLANARLSKRAVERRNWSKFGDAINEDVGSRLTMVSTEEILLERPRAHGAKAEETKIAGDNLAQLGKGGAVLMTAMAASGATKGAYVPPSMREGAERIGGSDMRRRNDENSVRVTNLSEDTREPDLLELFRTFGSVSRVYVAIDQKTGVSRGFGFVNFVNKEDAERAINKLNGYGYDNLILRVEWATPRSN